MITLFDMWEKFCGEVNTHQGGFIRPNRQFPNWCNDTMSEIFLEDYAVWQKDQIISDFLTTFLKSKPVKVIPGPSTYDIIPYPVGYENFSDCRFYHKGDYNAVECTQDNNGAYNTNGLSEQKITLIPNMRWNSATTHPIKIVTLQSPVMTQYDEGFKLVPKGINYVVMDWFRTPVPATFNYTLGPDDQIIYDVNSLPLECRSTMVNAFIKRLSIKYGKFVRDPFLYQTSDKEKEITA